MITRLAAALLTLACVGTAHAQAYPNRSIHLIVPFPPGGGIDLFARIVGRKLADQLGQQVVVDNRPGAQGNIGMQIGAKAPADGYTLTVAYAGTVAINPFSTRIRGSIR